MCIICNCDMVGDEFLGDFARVQSAMKAAAASMLQCSKVATDPAARVGYDKTHKQIVRLIREWNALEHLREQGHAPAEKPTD